MPHSYSNLLTHIVYSTKNRRPLIDPDLELRLFPYFGGIVRQLGGTLYTGERSGRSRSPSCPSASNNRRRRGHRKDQRQLHSLAPRIVPGSIRILLAAGIRCIQRQQVECNKSSSIHRTAEGTSQEAVVSGGVRRASTTTRDFDRRKIPLDVTWRNLSPARAGLQFGAGLETPG